MVRPVVTVVTSVLIGSEHYRSLDSMDVTRKEKSPHVLSLSVGRNPFKTINQVLKLVDLQDLNLFMPEEASSRQ